MRRHLHSRTSRLFTLACAAIAAFALACAFCSSSAPLSEPIQTPAARELPTPVAAEYVSERPRIPDIAVTARRSSRCIRPVATAGGGWALPPDRVTQTADGRRRTRKLVDLIAREMGADRNARRLLVRWAVRESYSNPRAVHIKPGDVRAASSSRTRRILAARGLQWSAHWSYGRGLYGMQPALYIPVWDVTADPNVLCDPIVATITAIWSARRQQRQCTSLGYPATILTANRRWGSGHCEPRERDAVTRAWWAERGRDADAPISWGRKWRESGVDRGDVYAHMREKAHAAGLLTDAGK
jgi:hypothetical protein